MIKITDNEIIDLLRKGYKKEILAFEFDLSSERLEKCVNQAKQKDIYSPEIATIIEKYNNLNSNTNDTSINQPLIQTELTSINEIEEKIKKINNVNNKKKNLKQIKTDLQNSTLTLEQYNLLRNMILNIDKRDFDYTERM